MKKRNTWMWVAVIAAVVAALTTVVVLLVRLQMKAKKRRLFARSEAVDYMMSDYDEDCCFCCDCEEEAEEEVPAE